MEAEALLSLLRQMDTKVAEHELVDTTQAAAILGVKPQTLANWRHTRRYDLPFVPIGRQIRYRISDVRNFIEISRKQSELK